MKINIFFLLCILIGRVYATSIPDQTNVCVACHGPTGLSMNPQWPNLAGQHASYLKKQLSDFKANNGRSSELMRPFVMNLSKDDIEQIALYYSNQALPSSEKSSVSSKKRSFLERGEQLYKTGDLKRHIPACIACHGPTGRGNAHAGFPVLSKQKVDYMIIQLQAFKAKQRTNDPSAVMQDISLRMTKIDMEAVSNYIATID
ncbi:MAG: c-type cytochrome [Legionellaceae bacterium]